MIVYLCRRHQDSTIRPFLRAQRAALGGAVRIVDYETLFAARRAPIAHYIFTDFDRLRPYERLAAERIARAVEAAAPAARILNRPALVRERYALLRALAQAGINSFDAVRLDEGRRPDAYPVFLRREDEWFGAESDKLHDAAEYDAALARLEREGVALRGYIAVGWRAQAGSDGLYRKYAAMRIGARIVPIHLIFHDHWVVKDAVQAIPEAQAAEEFAYVRDNPHRELLERVFALARIEYGRADYGVVDGRVEIYEINTNPLLRAGRHGGPRGARSELVRSAAVEALRALDDPLPRGILRFDMPQPPVTPYDAPDTTLRRIARAAARAALPWRLRRLP